MKYSLPSLFAGVLYISHDNRDYCSGPNISFLPSKRKKSANNREKCTENNKPSDNVGHLYFYCNTSIHCCQKFDLTLLLKLTGVLMNGKILIC